MSAESLLDGLDDEQRQVATTLLGPVCVLAGAGTGKTRAITHRIAYGVETGAYSPQRVLALTFTSRAAAELRSRLRLLGSPTVAARTFHAAALAQLGFFWPQVVGGTMPRILDGKARLLAHASDRVGIKLDTASLRDLSAEIEWRKVSKLSIEQYGESGRALPPRVSLQAALALQQAYEDLKDERRQLDFEDVLLAAAGMLDSEPRVAAQVREQYRFFVVDEYQDVNPLQHDLLRLWLGDRDDVCVVGDVSQTIYSFAGARPDYLLGFANEHPASAVVRLDRDYRSSPSVVAAANRLMRGQPGSIELRSQEDAPVAPAQIQAFDDDRSEARALARTVAAEIAGGQSAGGIAVLFRTNAQSALIESALSDERVPWRSLGGTRFFDQREVKEAIMLLQGEARTNPDRPLIDAVRDALRYLEWSPEEPPAQGATRARWENLQAVLGLAETAAPNTLLRAFVDDLLERQSAGLDPALDSVTISTVHAAKGLEWDVVHVTGVAEGLLPISYATTPAAVEEERRLLYVAITRARRRVSLSWSADVAARGPRRSPSRFLAQL